MAEFSKEWCEIEGDMVSPDFSVTEVFFKLKDGEYESIICEGFGFTHILNENGNCYVIIRGSKVLFELLIQASSKL